MSDQRPNPTAAAAGLRQQPAQRRTDLVSSATFLTFEPGLFAIDFRAASGSMSDVGLPLPCARLEPVTMPASEGRAFVSMAPDGGWLSRATSAAHILVVGGRAGAVLTIYRPTDGMAMPEVHFRSVGAAAPSAGPPLPPPPPGAGLQVMVHVEGEGDQMAQAGAWAGDTGGQRSIEGFALTLPAGMAASDVEYQGIMGEDWRTPWVQAGAFCGSRGLQLPLLGFCLRLVGDAAERLECRATGQFAGQVVGPVGSGAACHAGNMPLTAMRVELVPKQPAAERPAVRRERRGK